MKIVALGLVVAGLMVPTSALAQYSVAVDPTADVHPISPLIYGMNYVDSARVTAANIPMTRWGGNSTTRYNYQIDVTNTGSDYYFENVAGCWSAADNYCSTPPMNPEDQSGANSFLSAAAQLNLSAFFTVPTIGWVAKAPPLYSHPFDCGCPKTAVPQQDSFDPYDSNCGSGKSGGNWVQCPAATTTSTAIDPSFVSGWVTYLSNRFGPSNGKRIYALDNEPNLWSSTHHDVHPTPLTYDELWQRMQEYSVAILAADPTAEISGPAEWGWPNYFCSDADNINSGCFPTSPDRAAHGGEELVAWLLDQAQAYEKANGKRLLHYLDLHYYPQGGNPPDDTRSLWDPTYTDPSWINAQIRLIPRMRDWVNQHYPGTKISVSEYDFYHHTDASGAVGYVEVLGIFGREGLDAATAWSPPGVQDAAFGAYALYRNYDGQGGQFESTSVQATVTGGATLRAYAAVGATRLTVVLANEGNASATAAVTTGAFVPSGMAQWYAGNGSAIARQPDVMVTGGAVSVTLAATSFGMLVVSGQGPAGMVDAGVPMGDGAAPVVAGDAAVVESGDLSEGRSAGGDAGRAAAAVNAGCACGIGGGKTEPASSGAGTSGVVWWLAAGGVVARRARRRRGAEASAAGGVGRAEKLAG